MAQDVFHKYQILAKEKEIELKLNMPKDLPMVFADLGLVERVIQNLMDNALKFTPNGGKIQLDLRPLNDSVEIKIVDNGPGISEEQQAYIFERYNKANRKGEQTGGAGLGLAIVKKILELHDATIRVQSQLNQGTAFMFQLPAYAG
ncbi:MAG: signal transduction histidine kinase [Paraglaciecola sp.]